MSETSEESISMAERISKAFNRAVKVNEKGATGSLLWALTDIASQVWPGDVETVHIEGTLDTLVDELEKY